MDEYIFSVRTQATDAEFDALGEDLRSIQGIEVVRTFRSIARAYLVRMDERQFTKEILEALIGDSDWEAVPNVNFQAEDYPYGVDRMDAWQSRERLDGSFKSSFNGSGTSIFVVDTGLDCLHSEIVSDTQRTCKNIYDHFAVAPNVTNDDNGHGTHVAGTAAGSGVGIAPAANIYGIKVLDEKGQGSLDSLLSGLEFLMDYLKRFNVEKSVVNLSLAAKCRSTTEVWSEANLCDSFTFNDYIERLVKDSNCFVTVASGNYRSDACGYTPASSPLAMTVSAVDRNDREYISKLNPDYYGNNYGACVDIFAPGVDIISSCSSLVCENKDAYISKTGTSMATPHVAGAALLIWQKLEKESRRMASSNVYYEILRSASEGDVQTLQSFNQNYLVQSPQETQDTFQSRLESFYGRYSYVDYFRSSVEGIENHSKARNGYRLRH